jgi:flagellar biosynthesis protein
MIVTGEKSTANTTKAAALSYRGTSNVALSAKATGSQAEEILAIAQAQWIPIFENPLLLDLLDNVELNDEIPAELIEVITQLMQFALNLAELDAAEHGP